MIYLKVHWEHSFESEPVLLFSELSADRNEVRKVEVYRDGRADFADKATSSGTTRLSKEPIPLVEEIATDPQFRPCEIDAVEFEFQWQRARVPRTDEVDS